MSNTILQEYYGTLSQTMNALIELGYTLDFNIVENCLVCQKTNVQLSPEDFHIDKVYRFEGMSNPDDQAILYAISAPQLNVKGLLVNGYGIGSDDNAAEIIDKLKIHYPDKDHPTNPT